jgi:hypothetical protein
VSTLFPTVMQHHRHNLQLQQQRQPQQKQQHDRCPCGLHVFVPNGYCGCCLGVDVDVDGEEMSPLSPGHDTWM